MKEIAGKTLILDRVSIHSQRVAQKTPEKLCVPFLRVCSATFLPQVLRKPRTVIVAFAIGHECSQIPREVFGIPVILAEEMSEVFLGEQSGATSANEATVPYRMFRLKLLQLSKF